ncbi:MAG: YIP1 family protein [Candidatus Kryptonium sp.]|nr:YIP1 family protein [Candidatus Kryptonium sp.]MDW8109355.1 YIP1 family protein [Candidatus Kryptonium sp.]
MLCSTCGAENSKFNLKCKFCGAYLQNPVYVLNLFETLGLLILNPQEGFHKIIISKRKNYSFFLASLFGIAIAFEVFKQSKIGERYDNLIFLIFHIFLLGIPLGLSLIAIVASVLKFLLRKFVEIKFKTYFAVVAYSMFPIVSGLFFLYPSILAVFGIYYFTETPGPENLKPFAFLLFSAVGWILRVYSFFLLLLAIKHITENFLKALIFAFLTSICLFVLLNLLTEVIKIVL